MVIVSHLHGDHFDETAHKMLPKDTPIFTQPGNEEQIREYVKWQQKRDREFEENGQMNLFDS